MKVFSIYDEKALTYGLPFFCPTEGIAKRMFNSLVNDPASNVNKYPGDFKLYLIGSFNETTAELESTTPLYLAVGTQYVSDQISATTFN